MSAVELLPPGEAVHGNERWMELRRAGVTASEIAVVMGISPYGSPFSLYWQKVNDWRWEGNDLTSAGRHLEDAIAEWWAVDHANLWLRPAGLYAHPDRPWQIATPDRLLKYPIRPSVFRLKSLLECKWVAYSWDGWGEEGTDEVPVHYRAQALWQLDVLGVDEVHFAALGPGGFRSYLVRRDEDDLAVMRTAGEDFVRRLREQDPPDLDSHTATLGALKRLYPSVGEGEVQVPHSVAFEYREARRELKAAQEKAALHEAVIRDYLEDDHARAVYNGQLVASRSVFETRRIDSARLRQEQPEIAETYTTVTTVDKLTPGRAKK